MAHVLSKLADWANKMERRLRKSFGRDMRTPTGRFFGYLNYYLMDHAILRVFWTNFFEVAPGVYRSNQPTHRRFRKYRDMGVVAVLNLRGEEDYPHFHLAKQSCETLGMELHIAKLWARSAPKRARVLAVFEKLHEMPRPLLFHCKSGADRAGFVAAAYLIIFEGKSVAQARKMLSLRFIHLKWTKTGIQDYILDTYEARCAMSPISLEDWVAQEYFPIPFDEGWAKRLPPAQMAHKLIEQKRLSEAADGLQ